MINPDAYDLGWQAVQAGASRWSNPYRPNTLSARSWDLGWQRGFDWKYA